MKILAWVLGLAVGLFLLLLLIGVLSGPPDERSRARTVIGLCWDEQKRKSLDPGSARFVARMCEEKERDFEQKYGRKP